jgi:hypothetical protein
VEQERLTLAFMQYVLVSPRCTPELRTDAIVIFPELSTIKDPFTNIVSSAVGGLTSNAQQIAAQVTDKNLIQRLTDAIAELRCYKNLHEAIHQIQINPRPEVPLDDTPESQQNFRRALRQYVTLLRTSRIKSDEALNELPPESTPRQAEAPWVLMIGTCATKLQSALAQSDLGEAGVALGVTQRTVDPLPDQINTHIFAIARELPLDSLLDALRASGGAADQSDAVRRAVDAIGALRLALLTRVLEHSRWQETDNGFFVLDQTFQYPPTKAFGKFTQLWSRTRKQVEGVTAAEADSDWAVAILSFVKDVDHALAEVEKSFATPPAANRDDLFTSAVFESYDALRQEVRMRFFSVDSALKQSCLELLRIQAPLETIKAGIGP